MSRGDMSRIPTVYEAQALAREAGQYGISGPQVAMAIENGFGQNINRVIEFVTALNGGDVKHSRPGPGAAGPAGNTRSGGGGGGSGVAGVDPMEEARQRSMLEQFAKNKPPAGSGGGDASLQAALAASMETAQLDAKGADIGDPNKRRRVDGLPVGLKNTANTCYVNSLLQMYFWLRPTLVEAILRAPLPPERAAGGGSNPPSTPSRTSSTAGKDGKTSDIQKAPPPSGSSSSAATAAAKDEKKAPAKDKSELAVDFLRELQRTFAFLMLSNRKFYDPSPVVKAMFAFAESGKAAGTQKQAGKQEDITEYNMIIQDAIETAFQAVGHKPPTPTAAATASAAATTTAAAAAASGGQQVAAAAVPAAALPAITDSSLVQHMFVGRSEEELTVEENKTQHRTITKSDVDVRAITLDVDGGDLHTAMERYANQTVEGYKKDHTAVKSTWFHTFPSVLSFQLQRAGYDKVKKEPIKRNDRFTFENTFSVDRYLIHNRTESLKIRAELNKFRAEKERIEQSLAAYKNFGGAPLDVALRATLAYYELHLGGATHPDRGSDQRACVVESLKQQLAAVSAQIAGLMEQLNAQRAKLDACYHAMDQQTPYQLFAVMIHDGKTAGQGHYWAYVRRVEDGQWLALNDTQTSLVDETKVRNESFGGGSGSARNASAYFVVYIRSDATKHVMNKEYSNKLEGLLSSELKSLVTADNVAFQVECDEYDHKTNETTIETEAKKVVDEFEKRSKEYTALALKPSPTPFAKDAVGTQVPASPGPAPPAGAAANASTGNPAAAANAGRCVDVRLKSIAIFILKLKRKDHNLLAHCRIFEEAWASCSIWDLSLRDKIGFRVKQKLLAVNRATIANLIEGKGKEPGSVGLKLNAELTAENDRLTAMYNTFTSAVTEPFLVGLMTIGGGPKRKADQSFNIVGVPGTQSTRAAKAFEYFLVALYRHARLDDRRASRRIEILCYLRLCAVVMMNDAKAILTGAGTPTPAAAGSRPRASEDQLAIVKRCVHLLSSYGAYFFSQGANAKEVGFVAGVRSMFVEIVEAATAYEEFTTPLMELLLSDANPALPMPNLPAEPTPSKSDAKSSSSSGQSQFERHTHITALVQEQWKHEFAEVRRMLGEDELKIDDDSSAMSGVEFAYPPEATAAAAVAAAAAATAATAMSTPSGSAAIARTDSASKAVVPPAATAAVAVAAPPTPAVASAANTSVPAATSSSAAAAAVTSPLVAAAASTAVPVTATLPASTVASASDIPRWNARHETVSAAGWGWGDVTASDTPSNPKAVEPFLLKASTASSTSTHVAHAANGGSAAASVMVDPATAAAAGKTKGGAESKTNSNAMRD